MLIYEYIKKLLMNEKKTKCVSLLKYFIKFIKNLKIKILIYMTTGEKLKKDLGLENFKYVMIQKVINFPIPFFIITVDSRRPSTFLGYQKVKQLKSSYLKKFKFNNKIFDFSNYKLTPPFEIEQFTGVIPSHGMIFVRDIAGEYFMNKGLYESSLKKVYYEEIC